jgi:DNA polymerase III alpha subunit (gram-positive type)
MLSRRLYRELAHHDLDSLMASHALTAPVRHRALHDAKRRLAILAAHPSGACRRRRR